MQEGTQIEATLALLSLCCQSLTKIISPSRPMLFLSECLAKVCLPHLKAVHLGALSHKGKIGKHKPMSYGQLRMALQAIEANTGTLEWTIGAIHLIEDAPLHSLCAMEGTVVAAGVHEVFLEVKCLSGHEEAMLARAFPKARLLYLQSSEEEEYYSD